MLLLNNVINELRQVLHNDGRLTFLITDDIQQFHGWQVKTADDETYIAMVIQKLPTPPITEYYRTRALEYSIGLKGKIESKNILEEIIENNKEFDVNGDKWYLSSFIIQDIGNAKDGFKVATEFRATLRLSIYVPIFITNQDITVEVDGVKIDRVRLSGAFDKALVPNIQMGDNESDIATGEEYVMALPLSENIKGLEIISNVISKSFNKDYSVRINMVVIEKTLDLVLTGGNFNFTSDNNTAVVNAIFTRALDRTTIKINGVDVVVIGFVPTTNIIPIPINKGGKTRIRRESYTTSYQFQIENDNSQVVNDLVNEINEHTNKKFIVEWEFNGNQFSNECIVQTGSVPSSENPNAVVSVILTSGEFYGS